jgi:hypothetical protein
VYPLKAKYGLLINGLEIIIYLRVGENKIEKLRKHLNALDEKDLDFIKSSLFKPSLNFTKIVDVTEYFKHFREEDLKIYLNSDI